MTVYHANMALALTLVALCAGTALSLWVKEREGCCAKCAKYTGYAVSVLAFLAVLCTLYHAFKDYGAEKKNPHDMMMEHHSMMGKSGAMMTGQPGMIPPGSGAPMGMPGMSNRMMGAPGMTPGQGQPQQPMGAPLTPPVPMDDDQ